VSLLLCGLAASGCASSESNEAPAPAEHADQPDTSPKSTSAPENVAKNIAEKARGCDIQTGWAGDDRCIAPPEPSEGFQLHFGPKNYDDPEVVARYTLEAGQEALLCTYIVTPNEEPIYYDTWLNRLRPGSHHMTVTQVSDGEELDGIPCMEGQPGTAGIIGGNTTTVMPLDDVAPENQGFAKTLPARVRVSMQLHFFNTGDKPLLMEAWQNIYYKDANDVKGEISPIESMAGLGMSIERSTTEVVRGVLTAPQELRVLDLYSHNHDHTLRFSIFLRRAGEAEATMIYESYDWEHPLLLATDSIHENPTINRDAQQAGGMTGELILNTDDSLEFECEIRNDDVDKPLKFANEAHTAEMCIMRGNYAPSLGRSWSSYSR
jgi:hypothetical protein